MTGCPVAPARREVPTRCPTAGAGLGSAGRCCGRGRRRRLGWDRGCLPGGGAAGLRLVAPVAVGGGCLPGGRAGWLRFVAPVALCGGCLPSGQACWLRFAAPLARGGDVLARRRGCVVAVVAPVPVRFVTLRDWLRLAARPPAPDVVDKRCGSATDPPQQADHHDQGLRSVVRAAIWSATGPVAATRQSGRWPAPPTPAQPAARNPDHPRRARPHAPPSDKLTVTGWKDPPVTSTPAALACERA